MLLSIVKTKHLQSKKFGGMLKSNRILAVLLFFMIFLGGNFDPVLAERRSCSLQGRSYPDGSVVGNYRCSDGRWVARSKSPM